MNRALDTCSECGGPLQNQHTGSRCASCVARAASASASSGGRQPMAAGFGAHAEFEERTDDPHTIPAIPGSALEPAAPFAFSVGNRRKRARAGAASGASGADEASDDLSDELPSDTPKPAIDRAAHEIDAPLPPRALRQGPQASQPQPQPQPQPAPKAVPAPAPAPQRPSTLQAALSAAASASASASAPAPSLPSRAKSFTPSRPAESQAAAPVTTAQTRPAPAPIPAPAKPTSAPPAPTAVATVAAAAVVADDDSEPLGEDRWLSARSVAFGLMTAGWTAMSSVWFVLGTFVYLTGGSGLFAIVFAAVLHVWVALALGYVAMALLVNRTWVRLEPRGLELVNGPVPWPGRRFEVRALERVDIVPAATGARVGMQDVVLVVQGHAPIAVARSLDPSAARAMQARWTARLGEVEPSSART